MKARATTDGSSPRGRGTLAREGAGRALPRFIPARAGNAGFAGQSPLVTAVHPRAGGERRRAKLAVGLGHGSSPRGRGTRRDEARDERDRRFIPARAGNAVPVWARSGPNAGSSPRGRGTRSTGFRRCAGNRFIPARAGNAFWRPLLRSEPSVHPRAGGERSCQKRLIKSDIHDVKQRTGVLLMCRRRRLRLAKAYFHVRAGRRPAAGA